MRRLVVAWCNLVLWFLRQGLRFLCWMEGRTIRDAIIEADRILDELEKQAERRAEWRRNSQR